jgi:hypothetical protein
LSSTRQGNCGKSRGSIAQRGHSFSLGGIEVGKLYPIPIYEGSAVVIEIEIEPWHNLEYRNGMSRS